MIYPYKIHFSGCHVIEAADSGFVLASVLDLLTTNRGVIIRVSDNGSVLWMEDFGPDNRVEIEGIERCQDGGFITVGRSLSEGHGGTGFLWLVRFAENGTILWEREYSDCYWGGDIQECQDGGFVIVGTTPDVVRIDASGDILWNYTSDWYRCHAFSVVECDNGDIVFTGGMALADSSYDSFLVRLNESGEFLWDKTYDYPSIGTGWSLIQCNDSGFAIVGTTNADIEYNRGFGLLRTYGNGTILFENRYCAGWPQSVVECPDGGFAIAGIDTHDNDYTPSWDAILVRVDSEGNKLWSSFGIGPDEDRANCVVFSTENGYTVSGYTTGTFVETNENGTFPYDAHLPFMWRLNDESRENMTLIVNGAEPITTTTPSDTTTAPSTGSTSPTNTTGQPSFDLRLVTLFGVTGGVLVLVILFVGIRLRPQVYG